MFYKIVTCNSGKYLCYQHYHGFSLASPRLPWKCITITSRQLIFLPLLWKNDESCVSSLAEHVCRLKITDNRHMVGKSVIPLRICQDLGQGSGFPLLKLVKSEIPPGVLGRACTARARQVMKHSYLSCLLQEQAMFILNCTQLWCAFLFTLFLYVNPFSNISWCFLCTLIICYL